jgi:DNA polymerase III gamma/tau subunit
LNKSDLLDEEQLVKTIEYLSFKPHERVLATYSTSAKTGSHVDQIFQKIAYQMLKSE